MSNSPATRAPSPEYRRMARAIEACEAVPEEDDENWGADSAREAREATRAAGMIWDFEGWAHAASVATRLIARMIA